MSVTKDGQLPSRQIAKFLAHPYSMVQEEESSQGQIYRQLKAEMFCSWERDKPSEIGKHPRRRRSVTQRCGDLLRALQDCKLHLHYRAAVFQPHALNS